MDHQQILLTGATGIVGCEIVRELLRLPEPPMIFALLRGDADVVEVKRRWLLSWAGVFGEKASRLKVLRGDMTRPGLGLSPADRERVGDVSGILHAGAVTRFDQTAEAAHLNNVTSTRNLLELARRFRRVDRIGIVSTAFVAGRRRGTIQEDELDLAEEFNNEYEHSKALAEHEARTAMDDLPIAVYRLAIVVGRRADGRISRLSGIYPILRLFHEGLLAILPGEPEQRIDLIPADFAASAIRHLFLQSFVAGKTYQICAGIDRSFMLGELIEDIDAFLAVADPTWRRRGQPLPLPVSANVFRDFVNIVELTGNPKFRHIVRQTQMVMRQLEIPKIFDTRSFDDAIRGVDGLTLSHARDWLQPIVTRGAETSWKQPERDVPS